MSGGFPRFEPAEVAELLRSTLSTLESAVSSLSGQWLTTPPSPGAWSVARNLAHLAVYEDVLAAPALEHLLRGGDGRAVTPGVPRTQAGFDALETELEPRLDDALRQLRDARERQVRAVERFTADGFNRPSCILWSGPGGAAASPGWVAMKTVQHTWEHGTPVLQVMLFAPG